MRQVHGLLQWVGGAITRVAGTALVFGAFFVLFGLTPADAVVRWAFRLPPWMQSGSFKLGVLILGLVVIWASLRLNLWSRRQDVIDDLAEDLSWAIHELLNRHVKSEDDLTKWQEDYRAWLTKVGKKLGNRAFFTRADQIHFERLGSVPATSFGIQFNAQHNQLLCQLSLKFDRLRDIIQWAQMRGSR
jgi:hypothetical protein